MTIIVAFSGLESVRGFLGRWFIELKANVFVSSIPFSQAVKITSYIDKNYYTFEYFLISSFNSSQGFRLIDKTKGNKRTQVCQTAEGYFLILQKEPPLQPVVPI